MMLTHGIDTFTYDSIVSAEFSRGSLTRAFATRADLLSGIYTRGYERIAAMCGRHPHRGASGADAVIALSYDLVEQAATDPMARVVHSLESTQCAADSALASVHLMWRTCLTDMLADGDDSSPDPWLVDTEHRRVVEVVDVVVAALAGLCDPRRSGKTMSALFDHLYLVLEAVVPVLCTKTEHTAYLLKYLGRVHHYALASPDAIEPRGAARS